MTLEYSFFSRARVSCTELRLKENISNLCKIENEPSLVGLCELDREMEDGKIKLCISKYKRVCMYYV